MAIPLIIGIGGTTRPGSTSERAMQVALAHVRTLGCETLAFGAGQLPQALYVPGHGDGSAQALDLLAGLRRASGVILSTPAYHGGISGLIKNVLDYVEELREDARPYLSERAVGCIVCADGLQAMGTALTSLRSTVHALRGWPTPYGAAVHAASDPFGARSGVPDPAAQRACQMVAEEVCFFARRIGVCVAA